MASTWVTGLIGALGVFSGTPAHHPPDTCYVQTVNRNGNPVRLNGTFRHDGLARRWRVDYEDLHGATFSVTADLVGSPVGNPRVLDWIHDPVVGVWNAERKAVQNAVPLRWVVDLTSPRPRLLMGVRYISGQSGDAFVELDRIHVPDAHPAPLRGPGNQPEAVEVRVKLGSRHAPVFVPGFVFLSQPHSVFDGDEAEFRMRGLYRMGLRNYDFTVDYMDFVQANMVRRHESHILLTNGDRTLKTQPYLIEVDMTGRKPQVRMVLRTETDDYWNLSMDALSCPVTLLQYAKL